MKPEVLSNTNLSSQSDSSWRSKVLRGNSLLQYWHSEGSSLTAFSTARLRDAELLLISMRQLGQVAISSRSRASAKTWVKHPAHIRCPLVHYWVKFGFKIMYTNLWKTEILKKTVQTIPPHRVGINTYHTILEYQFVKLLGFIIDNRLDWRMHIDIVGSCLREYLDCPNYCGSLRSL